LKKDRDKSVRSDAAESLEELGKVREPAETDREASHK
jgi:hypothetical protein